MTDRGPIPSEPSKETATRESLAQAGQAFFGYLGLDAKGEKLIPTRKGFLVTDNLLVVVLGTSLDDQGPMQTVHPGANMVEVSAYCPSDQQGMITRESLEVYIGKDDSVSPVYFPPIPETEDWERLVEQYLGVSTKERRNPSEGTTYVYSQPEEINRIVDDVRNSETQDQVYTPAVQVPQQILDRFVAYLGSQTN